MPVAVLAARVTGGERSAKWLDLEDQLELDPASMTVVASAPAAHATLSWAVPEGLWVVIELYRMPDGEYVSLDAEAEPGFVTDHFDAARVEASLEALLGDAVVLAPYLGNALGALFVDSFELECERFFPRDLLAEFQVRRGYDLLPWLPAALVPGADDHIFDAGGLPRRAAYAFGDPSTGLGASDERVRFDYQQTVSELFVERFADTVRGWAEARGLGLRLQAYGLNVDVLRAFGAATTPEVEQLYAGGPDVFLKLGPSAAHLYGRAQASAEAFVWPGKDFAETPTLWKAAADKLFAAGVTRLVYHGFPYRKLEGYGAAGWHAFSSTFGGASTYASAVMETNPLWTALGALNRYVARVQASLRQGRPAAQVLVLYPWFGFPGSFVRLTGRDELLFNGRFAPDEPEAGLGVLAALVTQLFGEPDLGERGAWLLAMEPLLTALHAAGYSWDWTNEERLLAAVAEAGRIRIGDVTWDAVLLVDVPWMSPAAAARLAELAAAEVPVAVVGAPPARQPGLAGAEAGDAAVVQAMATLLAGPRATQVTPDGLVAGLASQLGVAPALRFWPDAGPLRHVRRALPEGSLTFFSNPTRADAAASVEVTAGCELPTWLDAWTGAATDAEADPEGRLVLSLPPYGSALLHCGGRSFDAAPFVATDATPVAVTGWQLEALIDDEAGTTWAGAAVALPDWRDVPELAHALGPGTYTTTATLPALPVGATVRLALGWVDGVADVALNDQPLGRALVPPFALDATAAAHAGDNTLRVTVVAPLRNAFIARGVAGDPEYRQFEGRPDALAPVGLRGPVTLTIRTPVVE